MDCGGNKICDFSSEFHPHYSFDLNPCIYKLLTSGDGGTKSHMADDWGTTATDSKNHRQSTNET